MAIVKFDSKYLKNQVCSVVSDAIGSLNNAYSYASNISSYNIPSDFKYRDKVTGYDTKIKNCKNKLVKFNNWVDTCEKVFSEAVREQEDRIRKIEDVSIKRRVGKI